MTHIFTIPRRRPPFRVTLLFKRGHRITLDRERSQLPTLNRGVIGYVIRKVAQ